MKTILHLCADVGSDSWPYRGLPGYEVVTVGSDIGVENYHPDRPIHGVIANPVCTEFSNLRRTRNNGGLVRDSDPSAGMVLVNECLRVIREASPAWWVIENPAQGSLSRYLGKPAHVYQPWHFGSPWSKRTGLWGDFTMPDRTVYDPHTIEQIPGLWRRTRTGRSAADMASLAYQHKSAFYLIPEFRDSGMPAPRTDSDFRSLCSQRFAREFARANP